MKKKTKIGGRWPRVGETDGHLHVEEVPDVLVVEGEDALEDDHIGPVHGHRLRLPPSLPETAVRKCAKYAVHIVKRHEEQLQIK